MLRIGITMRGSKAGEEQRDAIARDWWDFLGRVAPEALFIPIPNLGSQAVQFAEELGINGLILTGGDDLKSYPERDATELALLDWASQEKLPVFAVCRGMQVLAVREGGDLVPSPDSSHRATQHQVRWQADFEDHIRQGQTMTVNSFHNFCLREAGTAFETLALCDDGSIEAIRHKSLDWVGIAWHPERTGPEQAHQDAIFGSFLARCLRYSSRAAACTAKVKGVAGGASLGGRSSSVSVFGSRGAAPGTRMAQPVGAEQVSANNLVTSGTWGPGLSPGTVYWFTGLAGSGKSTLARAFYQRLLEKGRKTVYLDGDEMRAAIGGDLGYTREDRLEAAGRYGGLCKLLSAQGLDVVCATISMFNQVRQWNREHIPRYKEIYLRVDPRVLAERDQKSLYSNAINNQGEVVGVDQVAELPESPDVVVDNNGDLSVSHVLAQIVHLLNTEVNVNREV